LICELASSTPDTGGLEIRIARAASSKRRMTAQVPEVIQFYQDIADCPAEFSKEVLS
jgi:hypothetical protein